MHVLACRKRGLKLVRGRAVGTGPQNGCRIASLNCHGQSLEEVHATVTASLGEFVPPCFPWSSSWYIVYHISMTGSRVTMLVCIVKL